MNQIALMGRLTRDPELRQVKTGVSVVSFAIAVDRGYTPKDGGERQTDFIEIEAWRNTAEFVSKYFTKGQMVALTGRMQIDAWEDKEGNKRRSAKVVADQVYFTESKKSRDASLGNTTSKKDDIDTTAPVEPSDFAELDMDDGDLPF